MPEMGSWHIHCSPVEGGTEFSRCLFQFPQVKTDTDDAVLCCMMLCVLLHQVRLSATWFPEVFEVSLQLLHRRAGQRGRCYSCKSPESINTNDTIIKSSESWGGVCRFLWGSTLCDDWHKNLVDLERSRGQRHTAKSISGSTQPLRAYTFSCWLDGYCPVVTQLKMFPFPFSSVAINGSPFPPWFKSCDCTMWGWLPEWPPMSYDFVLADIPDVEL